MHDRTFSAERTDAQWCPPDRVGPPVQSMWHVFLDASQKASHAGDLGYERRRLRRCARVKLPATINHLMAIMTYMTFKYIMSQWNTSQQLVAVGDLGCERGRVHGGAAARGVCSAWRRSGCGAARVQAPQQGQRAGRHALSRSRRRRRRMCQRPPGCPVARRAIFQGALLVAARAAQTDFGFVELFAANNM